MTSGQPFDSTMSRWPLQSIQNAWPADVGVTNSIEYHAADSARMSRDPAMTSRGERV